MDKIVFQGLKITTRCRYLKFTLGNSIQINNDFERSVFEIIFTNDAESSDIVDDKFELVSKKKLVQTDYIKVETPIITLNGLQLKKIVQRDYIFSQLIVDNIEEFLINYKEDSCSVLIPNKFKNNIEKYITILKYNPYLEVVDYSNLKKLNNFYNINFSKKSVTINSTNEFAFNTTKKYEKYILRMVDVLLSFKNQLTDILKNYGLELIEYPKGKKINSVNYITYKVTELGAQLSRKTDDEETLRYAIQHKTIIDFDANFSALKIFVDFKNRYQNLDLVTNFTEFYTKDKLGRDWLSNIKWSPVSLDFEQGYPRDNQGNSGLKFTFNAELYYYVVYDEVLYRINEVIANLLAYGSKKSNPDLQEPIFKSLK